MAPSTFRRLDGERVLATITKLCRRIRERFPQSGLVGVGGELESLASLARTAAPELGKPLWALRAVVGFAGLLLAAAVVLLVASLREVRI